MKTKSLVLAILLLVSIAFVPCSRTQTSIHKETIDLDGFTVTLTDPVVDFPDSIDFRIEAEGEADILKITLQYRMEKLEVLPITNVVFPEFTQGSKTSAEWNWDMTQTGGLPPGADLTYWWSLEDASGHEADTPVKTVSFDDGRHKWKSIESTNFNLYWYNGHTRFAQRLIEAGEEALALLEEDTGTKPGGTIEVYIYGSTADLQGALIYPQEWTGGVAYTEYGVVALGISTGDLEWGEGAMAHETAHLVVHQVTMNGYGVSLPTWLDEGLAMYAEGELWSVFVSALNNAAKSGGLDSIQSLSSSFPADTAGATLAYAESYSIVDFLLNNRGGKENMLELLEAIGNGSGYEEALLEVYGLSVDHLDSLWKTHLMTGSA